MQLREGGNRAGGHRSVRGGARISSPGAGEACGPSGPYPQGREPAGGACGRRPLVPCHVAGRWRCGPRQVSAQASLQGSPPRSPPGSEGVWGGDAGQPRGADTITHWRRQLGESASSLPPHTSADLPPAPLLPGATPGDAVSVPERRGLTGVGGGVGRVGGGRSSSRAPDRLPRPSPSTPTPSQLPAATRSTPQTG